MGLGCSQVEIVVSAGGSFFGAKLEAEHRNVGSKHAGSKHASSLDNL